MHRELREDRHEEHGGDDEHARGVVVALPSLYHAVALRFRLLGRGFRLRGLRTDLV